MSWINWPSLHPLEGKYYTRSHLTLSESFTVFGRGSDVVDVVDDVDDVDVVDQYC